MQILITGGTGSLGTALVRRLYADHELTVYSRDEWKQSELRGLYPEVNYMLGDVRDYDRLAMAMRGCTHVIHAAAYKQVPSAEANVDEAIATNVLGSLNVARAAVHADVEVVVGLSTDKACQPINAYGQTKALMEKLFQQADGWSNTAFNVVRYGNVLGSRGSVVPLFQKQLRAGRKLTLTDPNMTRFWLTLEQACAVVMLALEADPNIEDGAILVPRCPASTMMTLADAVSMHYDNKPLDPARFEVIGTRAGEKLHESLVHVNESMHTRDDEDLMQVLPSDSIYAGDSFEYTSDTATQLNVRDLVEMLDSE